MSTLLKKKLYKFILIGFLLIALVFIISEVKTKKTIIDRASVSILANYTDQLRKKFNTYKTLPETSRPPVLTELRQTAYLRKQEQLRLLYKNPQEIVYNRLSDDEVTNLPSEIKRYVETELSTMGMFQISVGDDFKNRSGRMGFHVNDGSHVYALSFTDKPPPISSGSRVNLNGLKIDNTIIVESNKNQPTYSISVRSGPQKVKTTGNIKTLAILIEFNKTSSQNKKISNAEARGLLLDANLSLNNLVKENSFGKASLAGDVTGYYRLQDYDGLHCHDSQDDGRAMYQHWGDWGDYHANINGFNPNDYDQIFYIFSNDNDCDTQGYTPVLGGPAPGRTYIFHDVNSLYIYHHELGHTLGLPHSNIYFCSGKPIDDPSKCFSDDGGDKYDQMGLISLNPAHYSAPKKIALGWTSGNYINSNGTYTVSDLTKSGSPHALIVYKPNTGQNYYIQFRTVSSFNDLPSQIQQGALIQIYPGQYNFSDLLDMTPPFILQAHDEMMRDGVVLNDEINKIRFTQISHSGNSASIKIEFNVGLSPTQTPTPTPTKKPTPKQTKTPTPTTVYTCKTKGNYCIPSGENCDPGDIYGSGGTCKKNWVCCKDNPSPTPTKKPTKTPTPTPCNARIYPCPE